MNTPEAVLKTLGVVQLPPSLPPPQFKSLSAVYFDRGSAPDYQPPGEAEAPAVADLRCFSAASLGGKDVPPRSWLVREMIPGRQVTLLSGDGGTGKSQIALQLAAAVPYGGEWIGRLPEKGPVVFASAEDDDEELHRRLDAIAASQGIDLADLADLHIVPLAGEDAVMGAPAGKSGIIHETAIWRSLKAIVERVKPRLVVIDTLADVFAGNEISRAEARQFIGMLRGLAIKNDLAVVLLAHPSLSGMQSGSGTSGSTGWNNSVRSRLYFDRVKDADGKEIDTDLRVLKVMKANYGPVGMELRLRWVKGVFAPTGPAAAVSTSSPRKRRRTASFSTFSPSLRGRSATSPRRSAIPMRPLCSRSTRTPQASARRL